jgi:hypothetical protein
MEPDVIASDADASISHMISAQMLISSYPEIKLAKNINQFDKNRNQRKSAVEEVDHPSLQHMESRLDSPQDLLSKNCSKGIWQKVCYYG